MNTRTLIPIIACLVLLGVPRLCAAGVPSATHQGTGNLHAALEQNGSLLAKSVIYAGSSPTLKWNPALDKLRVSIEVLDVLKNKIVLTKDDMKNGGILRDGPKALAAGFYKVTYTANQESAHEYFVMGPPKTIFENLKLEFTKMSAIAGEARLNIGAQLRRGETLFSRENYDADNKVWQEKAIYTLASLASMFTMLKEGRQSIAKDLAGLHIRGFQSKIDLSTQYYRLFIPSTCNPAQSIPLLVVTSPPFVAKQKSFIESRFMEAHRDAVQIGKSAQKHGFAVLWPGYRNIPEGWTCESTHIAEAITAVENDYNIDKARISIYGTCGSGYFAGRLVSTYPRRFAAIVYDKAIFERNLSLWRNASESVFSWYEATNPAGRVIDNRRIGIFVFNDGSKAEGHGEIELSERFMKKALRKRADVKALLGRPSAEVPAWEMFFNWLATCRNEQHSQEQSGFLKESGYEGPISEVFSSPFIVVMGTRLDSFRVPMDSVVEHIKSTYQQQFYGVVPIVKNDYEITEEEMINHSLVLVGNPHSNAVWKKLEAHLPVKATPSGLFVKDHLFPANSAFLAVFPHPLNPNGRILTVGSYDLNSLGLIRRVNPGRAPYDCRVIVPSGTSYKTYTISKLNQPATNNQ